MTAGAPRTGDRRADVRIGVRGSDRSAQANVGGGTRLLVIPSTLREARAYVLANHRHHKPPQGGLFALACSDGEIVRGVAIVGNPVARMLDDDFTAEVTRLCTDGTPNACSILYAAAWRAARALGYRRLVTYTLASEGGASLHASGFRLIGEAGGGSWSRASRPRVDTHPMQSKLRWERMSDAATSH